MGAKAEKVWAALRALYEGETAGFGLLAQVAELNEVRLRCRAEREGWIEGGALAVQQKQKGRLQKSIEKLEEQVDLLIDGGADKESGIDKAKLDLLNLLLRSVEKLKEMLPSEPEKAKLRIRERDVRVSKVLQHLDGRISELARHFAAAMVEADRNQ